MKKRESMGLKNVMICSEAIFSQLDFDKFFDTIKKLGSFKIEHGVASRNASSPRFDKRKIEIQCDAYCPKNKIYIFDSKGDLYTFIIKSEGDGNERRGNNSHH